MKVECVIILICQCLKVHASLSPPEKTFEPGVNDTEILKRAFGGSFTYTEIEKIHTEMLDDMKLRSHWPFHYAAKSGDMTTVEDYINRGYNISSENEDKQTVLFYAAKYGKKEMVEFLIYHRASVNAEDNDKQTPLHVAALWGRKDVVELLINHGASVNAKDIDEQTPLHLSAQWGQKDVVELLINHGASVNAEDKDKRTSLHVAAVWGQKDVVELLINHGASVNAEDIRKLKPVHLAVKNGNKDEIELLINHGANINATDKDKQTPLHYAVVYDKKDLAELLINRGANINAEDKNKRTPLHVAAQRDNKDLANFIILSGANINAGDKDIRTPLHVAAQKGWKDLADLLIKHNASVDAEDIDKQTPLHLAAEFDKKDIAELLISHGASVNAENKDDRLPLHLACQFSSISVAEILISHKANVNAVDKNKLTPLHFAAQNSSVAVSELLIENRANVVAESSFKWTPLHFAAKNGKTEVAIILIWNGAQVDAKTTNGSTPLDLATKNVTRASLKLHMDKYCSKIGKSLDNFLQEIIPLSIGMLIAAGCIVIIIVVIILNSFLRERKRRINLAKLLHGNLKSIDRSRALNDQAHLLPYKEEFKFSRKNLKFKNKIGTGAFGIVYEGLARGVLYHEEETKVAIKMVNDMSDDEALKDLVSEMKIMMYLGKDLNVVNLLGAVTENIEQNEVMIIVEYCDYGNIRDLLKSNHKSFINQVDYENDSIDSTITNENSTEHENDQQQFEEDKQSIDSTMDSDSGELEKVPLKWLALESLIEPIYTVYSDVWSFGIVLWELFSLGAEPYPGIVANTFDELKTHLQDGHRMSKPDYATHSIYDVMYSCWNIDPNSRPLFDRLAKTFSDLMKPDDLEEFNHLNKTFENSIAQKYKSEENEENEENDESPQSCLCCTSRFFRSHKNLNESTECLVNITLLPIDNAN
ncbi:uncharacterized protein LOC116338039 isoform X1 [Contarinia nasturtii]|uniref:uncharacterized protein LOC116338039 isoform X1 n=1 Tax=Contarinia nasturtii TaxID=265458 RepID=UPI0012D3E6F3|nr:uncharacterized protein LOC116338039 isoform X1 [Contarinia nasturtii]